MIIKIIGVDTVAKEAKIKFNAAIAADMTTTAIRLAAKETGETLAVVNRIVDAKEESQGGPALVLTALMKNYGEDLAEFPRPGDEDSNKPERYKVPGAVRNGVQGYKTVSFYSEFFDNTKEGKAITAELEYLKRSQDGHDDKRGIPDHILAMNPEEVEARTSRLRNRKTAAVSAYRNAIGLGYQLEAVNNLPEVIATIRYEDKEETKPCKGDKAIVVRDVNDNIKYQLYSVSAFMMINVGKAKENGGTLDAVKKSVTRKGGSGQGGESDSKAQLIATMETFEARLTDIHSFMDNAWQPENVETYNKLLKKLGPNGGEGTDHLALTMYGIYTMLKDVFGHENVRIRAEKLQEAANVGDTKAAA